MCVTNKTDLTDRECWEVVVVFRVGGQGELLETEAFHWYLDGKKHPAKRRSGH